MTLLIASIVFGFGAPGLQRYLLDLRLTADVNAFVTAIQLSRSESAKRGVNVILCKTGDSQRCGDSSIGYELGWMVYVEEAGGIRRVRDNDEQLLWHYVPSLSGSIRSNRRLYEFRPYRKRSTNGTVTFCDRRGSSSARAVIVSYTGRPRVSSRGPGARPLICALIT